MIKKEDIIFIEPYAAAQSLKNLWTRLASTYKCIRVVLTPNQLIIRPNWFIAWLISLLGLDLYHTIPINQIITIENKGKWFSYSKVELTFYPNNSTQKKVLLFLKNGEEFIRELKQLMKQ